MQKRKGRKRRMTLDSSSFTVARGSMERMTLATVSSAKGRGWREGHFISHIDLSANSIEDRSKLYRPVYFLKPNRNSISGDKLFFFFFPLSKTSNSIAKALGESVFDGGGDKYQQH
ncbi:Uncharacterized protein Rs2_52035 [Raphanus sativus]|nr:Uncharacterized protein Rs2_52035 [Raphanus sativus]